MYIFNFAFYTLILSYQPCDIFKYYEVTEMHGLSLSDCEKYNNTADDSYLSGWCNLSPKDNKPFVFINLSRCTDDVVTTATVFHEMMHLSTLKYNEDWINKEEEMITFAENETYKIVKTIKQKKQ